jgi:hypothetical protein
MMAARLVRGLRESPADQRQPGKRIEKGTCREQLLTIWFLLSSRSLAGAFFLPRTGTNVKQTSAEAPKLEYTHVPCPDFDSRLARALDLIVALVLAYLQHGSTAVSRK